MGDHQVSFLFPRDVLSPSRPDAHFEAEAAAARAQGFSIDLIDHDAVVAGDLDAGLRGISGSDDSLVYRGWMIRPDRYAQMETELTSRGVALRTSAAAFRSAHHLPLWFDQLSAVTPMSAWTNSADIAEFEAALCQMPDGAAVIKDYSKSEKHYWDEAMFIPDVRDLPQARAVAERFLELRGEYFDGGFVVREYEDLGAVESRTWWVAGICVAVTAHPDHPEDELDAVDTAGLRRHVQDLDLAFVSVDVARSLTSGELRIVELGDGQVSDRPSSTEPASFIAAIATGPTKMA